MPQVIFNSRAKDTPFKTFLMDFDFEDSYLFTWETLFNTIHTKYGVNINVLKLINCEGKSIYYKNLYKQPKFDINNHRMQSSFGKNNGDFWINFDIYPNRGETLY